jgi:hypothetical protein
MISMTTPRATSAPSGPSTTAVPCPSDIVFQVSGMPMRTVPSCAVVACNAAGADGPACADGPCSSEASRVIMG